MPDKPQKKNTGGRPTFVPTDKERRLVRTIVAAGMPEEVVAQAIGIAPKTLRKHFRKELDRGFAVANAKVVESMFKQATGGKSVAATIFWLKARMGWSEDGPKAADTAVRIGRIVRLDADGREVAIDVDPDRPVPAQPQADPNAGEVPARPDSSESSVRGPGQREDEHGG